MYVPFNHNVVGCMSARRMILSDVFLSTTRGMLSQQGKIDLGTCSKLKLSRVAKEPATLNGNSRNRQAVVANGCNSEGATRRREDLKGRASKKSGISIISPKVLRAKFVRSPTSASTTTSPHTNPPVLSKTSHRKWAPSSTASCAPPNRSRI